jgi:glyoxylase-like metal-dependent hydrolase (beta-lactamase superfamily II)
MHADPSRSARIHRGLLAAGLLLFAGCATRTSSVRVGDVEVLTFRHDFANAHVLSRGDARILVDSGYGKNASSLDHDLRRAGIDPRTLRAVVVTHAHADHTGGARWFHDHYGVRVVAGAGDRADFAAGRNGKLCPVGFLGRLRHGKDQAGTFEPVTADIWIDQATRLGPLVGFDALVIPYASHTPGSLVVVTNGLALVGDLFRGAAIGSAAEPHFFMCDLAANRADIQRLLNSDGKNATQFFTGHFGPVDRDAVERRFGSP